MNKITSTLAGLALVAAAGITPALAQTGTFTFAGPGTFTFNMAPGAGFVPITVIPVVFNATSGPNSTGVLTLSGGMEQFGATGIAGTYTGVTEFFAPNAGQALGPFADVGTVFVSQRSAGTYDLASDTTTFTASGTSFDLVPGVPGAPVPEASTTASFGLLLALGLGGLAVAAKRKKAGAAV